MTVAGVGFVDPPRPGPVVRRPSRQGSMLRERPQGAAQMVRKPTCARTRTRPSDWRVARRTVPSRPFAKKPASSWPRSRPHRSRVKPWPQAAPSSRPTPTRPPTSAAPWCRNTCTCTANWPSRSRPTSNGTDRSSWVRPRPSRRRLRSRTEPHPPRFRRGRLRPGALGVVVPASSDLAVALPGR